jgi:hypothetical protein
MTPISTGSPHQAHQREGTRPGMSRTVSDAQACTIRYVASVYFVRHMNLDPGVLGAEDQLANLQAVREGTRVFSAYDLRKGTRIWIITEADRSATTILLPEEY